MTKLYDSTEAGHVLNAEDIRNLAEAGGKPADTLMNVVALIATRFRTDVCSAYLLEPGSIEPGDGGNHWTSPQLHWPHCACRSTKASPDWSRNRFCQ